MRRSLPLAVLLLAGCTQAATSRYPSLLPRPAESQSLEEPKRPVPVAEPDAALDTKIAALAAELDSAARAFTTAAQDAEAKVAVAQGMPEGSEQWLNAQTAMTEVGVARGPVESAVSALEELAIARGQAGQPPYPALDAAIARGDKIAADQAARSAMLEKTLAGT
jgi:hypothetical protein